jgi:hypothetical protein
MRAAAHAARRVAAREDDGRCLGGRLDHRHDDAAGRSERIKDLLQVDRIARRHTHDRLSSRRTGRRDVRAGGCGVNRL